MTDRATLTRQYLDQVTSRGITATELLGTLPGNAQLNALYLGNYLPRPVFLGAAELAHLSGDLEHLRSALASLPDRCFGGDLGAFARAAGMTEAQTRSIVTGPHIPLTRFTRPDLYLDADGFHALEFGAGSCTGGFDSNEVCRELLAHPLLAAFARDHGLSNTDSIRAEVDTIFRETGTSPGGFPVMAMTSWPLGYPQLLPYLEQVSAIWRELGLDARPCHAGELTFAGGRVRLAGTPVDIVFRIFLAEQIVEPADADLIEPIMAAAAAGQVALFTPLDSELYASKTALAMISDERNWHLFSPAEQDTLKRLVPWTRRVAPGPVITPDGSKADLFSYAAACQQDLVLKPALRDGGRGVVVGDDPAVSPGKWRDHLDLALHEPHVLQQRIRPEPELFPGPDGELEPWLVTWGVFTAADGYGGLNSRGVPVTGHRVISVHNGAHFGGGLVQLDEPAATAGEQGV
jgi:hypothetical protein